MKAEKRTKPNSDASRKRVKLADDPQVQTKSADAPSKIVTPAEAQHQSGSSHFDRADLVAGSYERLLYGFQASFDSQDKLALKPVFSFPAHLSCIKAASCSPGGAGSSNARHYLVTSSTDDTVKLWDLAHRKEIGLLVGHEAPATRMQFLGTGNKQLLTCSEDGTLKLFRTKDWALIRNFKGHKARVNYVDVHPAGRIALSVSADRTIRFWDLLGSKVTAAGGGKQGSSSTKLGAEGDLVRWNIKGDRFAVICGRELRLFTIQMTNLATLTSKSRFHDVKFIQLPQFDGQECMIVGCEDGKARVYPLPQQDSEDMDITCVAELSGHTNRIKEFQTLPLAKSKGALAQLVFTSSSDGRLHIYDLSQLPASAPTDGTPLEIQPALAHDTKGSRLTCLSVSGYLPGQGASAAGRVSVGGVVQTEDSDEDTSDSQNDDDEEEEDSDDDSDLDELAQEMPEIDSDISEEELAAAIAAQAQGSDDDDDEDEEEGEAWSGIQ